MKKAFLLFVTLFISASLCLKAQVQVDHPIQLTGAGANAEITGIKTVANNQDATSVDVIQKGALVYAADAGLANAYSVTLSPAVSAYTSGMIVNFEAANANTGASTLSVNGLSAKTIKKQVTTDLAANDILANQSVSVIYDGTNFQMLSQLGSVSAGTPHGRQLFTSSGMFNVPAGVTTVYVSMSGGGGSGGASVNGGGGGGGGAAALSVVQTVTPSTGVTITVGSGGTTVTNNNNGNPGTNSAFGSFICNGGSGGNQNGSPGAGGTASAGTIAGGAGSSGYSNVGGNGGGSIFGSGGGSVSNAAATDGGGYGGGGGGGTVGFKSGNGTPGFVLVEW